MEPEIFGNLIFEDITEEARRWMLCGIHDRSLMINHRTKEIAFFLNEEDRTKTMGVGSISMNADGNAVGWGVGLTVLVRLSQPSKKG